jgi:hypothetical protein
MHDNYRPKSAWRRNARSPVITEQPYFSVISFVLLPRRLSLASPLRSMGYWVMRPTGRKGMPASGRSLLWVGPLRRCQAGSE